MEILAGAYGAPSTGHIKSKCSVGLGNSNFENLPREHHQRDDERLGDFLPSCRRVETHAGCTGSLTAHGKTIREGSSSFEIPVQNALVQQEWRVPELLHRLLEFLTPHLTHRYKNVRDRIGSLLSNIFLYDYSITPECTTKSPTGSTLSRK
uniref:Uncharacterized protein n=1 Tax=Magallana gigas TaxID=29159 RepID=A0A8W8IBF7_MAGGI